MPWQGSLTTLKPWCWTFISLVMVFSLYDTKLKEQYFLNLVHIRLSYFPISHAWIPQSEDFCLQKVREINKNNWCIPFILVAQTVKNLPAMQETWVWSLGQKGHQEKEWQPTPVFLAGEFHEQRSMAGCRPCGHKQSDRTARLTLFTFYPDSQILNILQHALTFSLCEVDISFSEPFETRLYTLCLNNSVFFLRTRIY